MVQTLAEGAGGNLRPTYAGIPCARERGGRNAITGRRAQKKTAARIQAEVAREIETLIAAALRDRERDGSYDLEALERYTREVMLECGAHVLAGLLELEDGRALGRACPCGGTFQDKKRQRKTVRTLVGNTRILHTHQQCTRCATWRSPEDIVLDIVNTGFSPGLRRAMAETGGEICFEKAAGFLDTLGGVRVGAKDVERVAEAIGKDILARQEQSIRAVLEGQPPTSTQTPDTLYIAADGTGVPMRRKETQGRAGKHADGIARTREAKLGALFTQATTDEKGNPVREAHSTTYVGKIESVDTFGPRLFAEALRRGFEQARRVGVLGDGAVWIWNLASEYFPNAVQIVDYCHAHEHLSGIGKLVFPDDEKARKTWQKPFSDLLWDGDIPALTMALREVPLQGKSKEFLTTTIEYFNTNRERMRYRFFREQGLFIGSGVVEAGCRSLIGERLKCSGMHWSVPGADAIIALRCCLESNGFENYWEDRRPTTLAA